MLNQLFYEDTRERIAEITIDEFEKEYIVKEGVLDLNEVRENSIKRITAEFGLTFLISIIVGWIITKILDYLLDTVTLEPKF